MRNVSVLLSTIVFIASLPTLSLQLTKEAVYAGEAPAEELQTCPGHNRALVLSGGGIRGAYQVGALWYLTHVLHCDFRHFIGTSTGSISAAVLSQASTQEESLALVDGLVKYYTDAVSPASLADDHAAAKLRLFLPHWLGGIDGIYSLNPLEENLKLLIDPSVLSLKSWV